MKIRMKGSDGKYFDTGQERIFVNTIIGSIHRQVYLKLHAEMVKISKDWFIFFLEKMRELKTGNWHSLPKKINSELGYKGPIIRQTVNFYSKPGTGSIHWKRKKFEAKGYIASAEGEYPATVTGEFLEKLKINVTKLVKSTYGAGVTPEWMKANSRIRITITAGANYSKFLIESGRLLTDESKEEFWMMAKGRLNTVKDFLKGLQKGKKGGAKT